MLDPTSRVAIIAVSGLCALSAFMLSPARAREASDSDPFLPRIMERQTIPDGVAVLPVARDPFREPALAVTDIRARPPEKRPAQPAPANDGIMPLPSNLANDTIPAMPDGGVAQGSNVRVTAVVTGAHPYALIDIGGVHQIKGLGDRIGNDPIVSIDLDGIRVKGGAKYGVEAGTHS